MAIRTIFSTAEDCSLGARRGWSEFIRDYSPIARTLLLKYFPGLPPDIDQHLIGIFTRAHADNNAWFRNLHFTNEREFAMTFRDLVFAHGNTAEHRPAPAISAEDLARALTGFSLVQREFFWGFLKGWNVQEISAMLMNAAATAEEAKKTAEDRLSALIGPPGSTDRAARVRAAIETANSAASPECLSWKTFNNLINGQISWLDRERAEQHMSECLHCLNAFTAFQEMIWLARNAQAASQPEVERILSALELRKAPSGFLKHLFPTG
jgi:hypothetical protein